MKQFDPKKAFEHIRAENQRQKRAHQKWAQRERQKMAAYSTRSKAFNRLMQLFPREAAGCLDIQKAAALMVEIAQTISPEWVKARVRFVSDRLAELPEHADHPTSLKEISLNLLLVANAGDHAQVATIFTEAMRGDPDDVESFRLCLGNWLEDKVIDGWPPLPEELKPPAEASVDEVEVSQSTLLAQEEGLPASKAVERAEQSGRHITLKWLTQDAHKHGVRIRQRQLPGKHKKEVEWGSLARDLLKRARAEDALDETTIDRRIRDAQQQKRREHPVD